MRVCPCWRANEDYFFGRRYDDLRSNHSLNEDELRSQLGQMVKSVRVYLYGGMARLHYCQKHASDLFLVLRSSISQMTINGLMAYISTILGLLGT